MAYLNDRVLDNGLAVLDAEATHIYICSAEPATYAAAVNAPNATTPGVALGAKNLLAGGVFGPPSAATPNGRRVSSAAVADGAVTTSGTASHYAVVDSVNTRLLAANALASPQAVTGGNTFTLPSFDVRIPAP